MIYIYYKNDEKRLHNNQIHLYKNHYLQGNAFIQSCYTFLMSKENIHTNPFCMDRLQPQWLSFSNTYLQQCTQLRFDEFLSGQNFREKNYKFVISWKMRIFNLHFHSLKGSIFSILMLYLNLNCFSIISFTASKFNIITWLAQLDQFNLQCIVARNLR